MKKLILILFFISSLFGQDALLEAARDGTLSQSQINELISKCNSGDGISYRNLGVFYFNKFARSRSTDRDSEAKGLIYYEKACNLRNGTGCFAMAAAYGERIGYDKSTPHDPAKRLEYLTKGCEYNSPSSCDLLGIAYSREARTKSGAERKALELKAKRFYQKACDLAPNSPCVY